MNCPVCDQEIPKNSNFCSNCGCCVDKSLSATPVAALNVKRQKTVYQILFFVALAIAAALAVLWLVKRNTAGNEQAYNEIKIAEYEQQVAEYEQQIAEYENAKASQEAVEPLVYIPIDGSYLYHDYDCEHYDHSIYCYVTDRETAEQNGCAPCPQCMGENGR